MRKLLVVTSKPLDPRVESALRKGRLGTLPVESASAAQAAMAQEAFPVGLAVVWPDTVARETTELAELVQHARTTRWVVVARSPAPRSVAELSRARCGIALGLCSLPLDPERLAVILGHAYGMAEVESRFLAGQRTQTHELAGLGMIGESAADAGPVQPDPPRGLVRRAGGPGG